MDFVIQWLWYLLAFVAGSAVAFVGVAVSKALSRSREVGGR
jgi:hypothetical protein